MSNGERKQRDRDKYRILAPEDVGLPSYSFKSRRVQQRRPNQEDDSDIKEQRRSHIESCLKHVKAEYWAFFLACTQGSETPGWRARSCYPYLVDADHARESLLMNDFDGKLAKNEVEIRSAIDERRGGNVDLAFLKGSLCIWRDNLYLMHKRKLTCGCRTKSLFNRGGCDIHEGAQTVLLMRKLRAMLPDFPDADAARHRNAHSMLYSMGLVMPFIKSITMLELMLRPENIHSSVALMPPGAPKWPNLDIIYDPIKAQLSSDVKFNEPESPESARFSPFNAHPDVQLRPEQLEVIRALRYALEIIQGPPGTGKTTIIRAVLRQCISYSREIPVSQTYGPKLPIRGYIVTPEEADRSNYPHPDVLFDEEGWVTTTGIQSRRDSHTEPGPDPDHHNLFGLDCEMVGTDDGSVLARVSLVGPDGSVLYDSLVKPEKEVKDYRTQFSGITEEMLANVNITLRDVQAKLLEFISEDSILVGHSLENDLEALRLVHERVIDTALIYPHRLGWPRRCSLALLSLCLLQDEMKRDSGHDSIADAQVSLKLAQLKVEKGRNFGLDSMSSVPITLLLAVQNKAVDVLVRGFEPFVENDPETSDVGMLVIGSNSNPNIGENAARFTVDGLLLQNTLYKANLDEYKSLLEMGRAGKRAAELKEQELINMRHCLTMKMLGRAKIMFCTTTELVKMFSNPALRSQVCSRISSIVIDEAGTVPEYDMAVMSCLPALERIICVGDVKQLPPFSHLRRSNVHGFMERVQIQTQHRRTDGYLKRMLTRQFRMQRYISELVSTVFYEGKLIMDETEGARRTATFSLDVGFWLSGIYWLDYSAAGPTHMLQEIQHRDGHGSTTEVHRIMNGRMPEHLGWDQFEELKFKSRANATEIMHIVCGLELFCDRGLFDDGHQSKSVAVISFYKLQNELLEATLGRSRRHAELQQAQGDGRLKLRTVDSFQGNEADIIILSGVRSNVSGEVGFLSSGDGRKRICVALSRAKEALVIVGDRRTLTGNDGDGPLAFSHLWEGDQPNRQFNVQRLASFHDLLQRPSALAARRRDEEQIMDLFR